ncbi:hypothetical protein A2U01_0097375, partial [Trifolium medium]|nr:hypothetical protein [Trifolium medium]
PEIAVGSDKQQDTDPTAIENASKEIDDVHSHSDEVLNTGTKNTNVEKPDEQNKDTCVDAIDVDNLSSGDSPVDKSPA